MEVCIYTDGAYSPSRDVGGVAFVVLIDNVKIYSTFYSIPNTTNNRMEIEAVIAACEWCIEQQYNKITIYTDSMYIIGTMTKNWKRNVNSDLWNILDILALKLSITWKHVKGHSGNKYNELCDALAVEASKVEQIN